jgi:hypothetical protein
MLTVTPSANPGSSGERLGRVDVRTKVTTGGRRKKVAVAKYTIRENGMKPKDPVVSTSHVAFLSSIGAVIRQGNRELGLF